MLNKPRGLVTTRHDPEGRPTVYDCLKDFDIPHLSPVGRLDKASEGLLLFTNDTEFAQALLDPITHVTKTYHVQVNRIMDDEIAVRDDIRHPARRRSADGDRRSASARAATGTPGSRSNSTKAATGRSAGCWRRCGTECLRLVRVAIGGLELGELPKGSVRALTEAELQRSEAPGGHGKDETELMHDGRYGAA